MSLLAHFAEESITVSSAGWDSLLPETVRVFQSVLTVAFMVTALMVIVRALLALTVWKRKQRRAPGFELATLIAMFASLFLAQSLRDVSETVATIDVRFAAELLAFPAVSLSIGFGGIVWIARNWRMMSVNACIECTHALLPAQSTCPECGALCVSSAVSTRVRRQRRVLGITLLAFVSAIAGFRSIGWLGNTTLPWRAKMLCFVEAEADKLLFVALGEGVVLARAAPREAMTEYGPRGGIRALYSVLIEEPHLLKKGATSSPFGVAVLPALDVAADEAWFDRVQQSLSNRPPEFARAGLSWARTVAKRLQGDVAHFDPTISEVYISATLMRPFDWWALAVPLAGPLAASVLVGLVALIRTLIVAARARFLSRSPAQTKT